MVPWFPLLGLTPSGLFMGLISTITYTSELILCFIICVLSATRHNIHMYPYFRVAFASVSVLHHDSFSNRGTVDRARDFWLRACLRLVSLATDGVVIRRAEWSEAVHVHPFRWFFCFRLRQCSFHWKISDGVLNGIVSNGNVLILWTPILSSLLLRLRLRLSIFIRLWALFGPRR